MYTIAKLYFVAFPIINKLYLAKYHFHAIVAHSQYLRVAIIANTQSRFDSKIFDF